MSLEELKKLPPSIGTFDWRGGKVRLRKLSAKDHLELFCKIKEESEQQRDGNADRLATVEFHIDIAGRSLCDEHGKLLKDDGMEDVRNFLIEDVAFEELVELGSKVLSYSGYDTGGQKKTNSVGTNDSPTNSA